MRIFLLSKADLFGNIILNRLLPVLSPRHQVRVYLSDRIFPGERGNPWSDAYMYYSRDYLVDTFFPALDRTASDAGDAELLSFAALSRRHLAPVMELGGEAGDAGAVLDAETLAHRPDLLLCCRHDFIVPESIYSRAPHGAYNMHSGDLPAYRGPFCSFWAMHNGDRDGACAIHALNPKVDAGDVIGIGRTRFDYDRSLLSNMIAVYMAGADVFLGLLPELERGPLSGIPQPRGSGCYYPQPNAGACGAFVRGGGRFVDAGAYGAMLGRYLGGLSLEDVVGGGMPARTYRENQTA